MRVIGEVLSLAITTPFFSFVLTVNSLAAGFEYWPLPKQYIRHIGIHGQVSLSKQKEICSPNLA